MLQSVTVLARPPDFVMPVTRTSGLPSIYGPIWVERSVPGHRSITIKNVLKARAMHVRWDVWANVGWKFYGRCGKQRRPTMNKCTRVIRSSMGPGYLLWLLPNDLLWKLLKNVKKCSFKHREHLRIFRKKAPAKRREKVRYPQELECSSNVLIISCLVSPSQGWPFPAL